MSIGRSMITKLGCRSGIASFTSSQKRSINHNHIFRGFLSACHPKTSRVLSDMRSIQKCARRRFGSSGNVKTKGESKSMKGMVGPGKEESSSSFSQFWKSFLAPKPMPDRWSAAWYREMVLICTVFAITGSSTMVVVRPAVSNCLGLEGSFKDGPWSFRICSLVIMTPIYATLLLCVGTVFGRHAYFRHFSVKMWSRFGIPPEMIDKNFHIAKKTFRKW